jgi:hypothetical protein
VLQVWARARDLVRLTRTNHSKVSWKH